MVQSVSTYLINAIMLKFQLYTQIIQFVFFYDINLWNFLPMIVLIPAYLTHRLFLELFLIIVTTSY